MSSVPYSPTTGEVVELSALVAEYIAIIEARDEAQAEASRLDRLAVAAYEQIAGALPDHGVLRAENGDAVVRVPGRAGNRRIDPGVAQEHQERLLSLGLGERVTEYKPPTLSDVQARIAEVAAAGVPLDTLIRPGNQQPPTLKIVRAGSSA